MLHKKLCLSVLAILFVCNTYAGNRIKAYFNHPVDTSVSTGVNAVYLNSCMADTLVAYINRSRYTLDIAVYSYTQGSYANIATAVNSAYSRGVRVRWIYDSSMSNTGMALLNPAINKLSHPTTTGIMHCKFVIVDGRSSNPDDAFVWTGSPNWTTNNFNSDFNNVVIIQDSGLAHAYLGEFNHMWGDTGLVPNVALAKFGPAKSDLGRHLFTVDGNLVEVYFSPSDSTNNKIQATINTANKDLYFAMYAFTHNANASLIMSRHTGGVYVAGINDNFSHSYGPYTTFTSGLGSNFKEYTLSGIYHNKYMIVDPSDKCSDPLVLTGSHNWSLAADDDNDENTLIIHDDTLANIYYQSFRQDFISLSGSLTLQHGCTLDVEASAADRQATSFIYPNPSHGDFTIGYSLSTTQNVSISVYNSVGQKIASPVTNSLQAAGNYTIHQSLTPGLYFVHFTTGNDHHTRKICIIN